MTPAEFDELLLGFRIYVRDYDCSDLAKAILEELEVVAQGREVGGREPWQPAGWDDPDAPEGGVPVPA